MIFHHVTLPTQATKLTHGECFPPRSGLVQPITGANEPGRLVAQFSVVRRLLASSIIEPQ